MAQFEIIGNKKLKGSVQIQGSKNAALTARGKTTINNIELIERGYYLIEERLKKLGAEINRII